MKRAFLFLFFMATYFSLGAQTGSLDKRLSYAEDCLNEDKFEEAEKVLIEIQSQCLESESDSIKAVFCHLAGWLLLCNGDAENGIQYLQSCCVLCEKEEDIFMNEYWDSTVGIVDAYVEMEEYQKAAYFCRRFLVRNEEVLELNPSSLPGLLGQLFIPPQIAWIYSQLGKCMEALGDSDIVDRIYLRGQQYADKYCDAKEPWAVINLYNLRRLYLDQGRYDNAHDQYYKISEKMAEAYGARHPEYVKSIGNIVSFYYKLSYYEDAVSTSEYILKLASDSIGLSDPSLSFVYPPYLVSLSFLGRYGEVDAALPYARMAINQDKESTLGIADLYYYIAFAANKREDKKSVRKYYDLYLSELDDKSTAKSLE